MKNSPITDHLKLKSISVLFILYMIGLGTTGCNRGKSNSHSPVEKINPTTLKITHEALDNLKLTRAVTLEFPEQLSMMGKISVTEDRTHIVPARVSGRIQSISFASGEYVRAGQLLATLFSPDFIAAKEEYLQTLKPKQSTIGNADPADAQTLSEMARKKLLTMGVATNDITEVEENQKQGRSLASARNPDAPESMLKIRAPNNGAIIAKAAVLGNLVNVGDTLFTIGDLSKIWFLGDLYPEDLPKVHKNQLITINVPGVNKALSGTVSFISPIVDPLTRSIKIRALIDNPEGILKGDMYVQGNLTLNKNQALLVPTASIVRTALGYYIFKKISVNSIEKENNSQSVEFQKIAVKLGPERQGMTSILEGVTEGDEVVSDGALLLDAALTSSDNA